CSSRRGPDRGWRPRARAARGSGTGVGGLTGEARAREGAYRPRCSAAAGQPPLGGAGAAAPSGRARHDLRRHTARRPRRAGVARHGRPAAADRPERRRVADPERAARRRVRRLGAHEPRDRAGAVRHAENDRSPPDKHLPQARDQLALAASGRALPEEQAATDFFTAATRNLQQFGSRASVRRIIVVSIIGTDRFTAGYGAAKQAHERAMLAGPIPAAIVRAAQFHEFVSQLMEWGRQDRTIYLPKMRTQLVAARTVAETLADLATGRGPAPARGP